jgi:hypothetical protein
MMGALPLILQAFATFAMTGLIWFVHDCAVRRAVCVV